MELSNKEESANSPVTYGVQEQIPVARSPPIRENSPSVIEESPKQSCIAPGTPPATHFDQLRSHGFGAVIADSDILEPAISYESVGKGTSSSEPLGSDVLFEEVLEFSQPHATYNIYLLHLIY